MVYDSMISLGREEEYMRVNGLENIQKDVIPCFETDGDDMDIYIACK